MDPLDFNIADDADEATAEAARVAAAEARQDAPGVPTGPRPREQTSLARRPVSAKGRQRGESARNGEMESPHNMDAEQGLLASCLLEHGDKVLADCLKSGFKPPYFYRPAHQHIFAAMVALSQEGKPADEILLANKLKDMGQLDAAGGHAYLYELTERIQTTVHAKHWLGLVREKFLLRTLIRTNQWCIEQAQGANAVPGQVPELLEVVQKSVEALKRESVGDVTQPANDLFSYTFTKDNPNNLLGKDEFVERGGSMLVVSNAGVGKSSLTFQSAATWALGRPFFGIQCVRPLRSLIVQWEDSDRYTAKCAESLRQAWNLDDEAVAALSGNGRGGCVKVIRLKGVVGDGLWTRVRALAEQHHADLVYINPISNFIEGDLSQMEVAVKFFNDADRANPDDRWAYIFVHHTGKPPQEDKGKSTEEMWKQIYMGYGNSVFANRPRASIQIEPRKGKPGEFWLHLGKGGRNAGVTVEVEHGAGTRMEPTTQVAIKYTDKKLKMPWGEHPMFLWEVSETPADEAPPEKNRGGRPTMYNLEEVLSHYPLGADKALGFPVIVRNATEEIDISESTMKRLRADLLEQKRIQKTHDGRYFRPTIG